MGISVNNPFNLTLNLGIDDSVISDAYIDYLKPDGTSGSWPATVNDGEMSITYTVEPGEVDISGVWVFQAFVVTPIGGVHGDPVHIFIGDVILPEGHVH